MSLSKEEIYALLALVVFNKETVKRLKDKGIGEWAFCQNGKYFINVQLITYH